MTIPTANDSAQLQDTFQRGTNRRIDYILGTDRVLQSICHRGALAYNDGIMSNHQGLFLDLDPHLLFSGNASGPVSRSSRGFTLKNDKKVTEYVNSLERYWLDHHIPDHIQRLSLAAPDLTQKTLCQQYDAIDRDIKREMLAAEKTVRCPNRGPNS
jgi:hypothetical protein